MSKIIYVCYRHNLITPEVREKILNICEELNPDNIKAHPTDIFVKKNLIYGITNPISTINKKDASVILGKLFEKTDNWEKISANPPDGNFAIFRTHEDEIEILTDCLGNRRIWYYFDEEKIIASSSQKAIVRFLGDFIFDERVIPWMLSTGTLGPNFGWDKRIKSIPPDGKLYLNQKKWDLKIESYVVEFKMPDKSEEEYKNLLKEALQKTFGNIQIDLKNWVITLSGGHDSRAVLLLLKKFGKSSTATYKTITWGKKNSILDEQSDAFIAKMVAANQQTYHNYYSTEDADEPIDIVVERFLNNGEGRIDHITGYLDGFKIWKKMFEDNIEGVVRGDEVFGYNKIYSPLVVNSFMGLTLCSDYRNLSKYEYINALQQEMPEELKQNSDESLSTWRDRIFHSYRIPYAQSALADLKYAYVEQINPFLSKNIVAVTRQLPDYLRTDKKLFKKIMTSLDPGIPFSKRDSNTLLKDALKREDLVTLIKEELTSSYAKTIFPSSFLEQVINNLKTEKITNDSKRNNLKFWFFGLFPKNLKKFIAQQQKTLTLDENILAFRILIICRMYKILKKY